ncbi:Acyl-CoA N-acyltransferase [Apiospora phragmitis]|uniref:Acyl-CoA N-acyltransferase n=1 Tax=Apiospora phragmitis TaxID=2905665 RepID=A0ABR1TT52_9PEZI
MPLELREFTLADLSRGLEIEKLAYVPNPFTPFLFPGPFAEEANNMRSESFVKTLEEDKTARHVKVIDTEIEGDGHEQMVAWAKVHVYKEPPELTPRVFGPGSNIEACEKLWGGLLAQRTRLVGDKPHVYLHMLQTHPTHQGRGAGTMLIQWALRQAQELGMPAYLEASPDGHSLYLKNGFKDIDLLETDLSQWGAKCMHKIWNMIWYPKEV